MGSWREVWVWPLTIRSISGTAFARISSSDLSASSLVPLWETQTIMSTSSFSRISFTVSAAASEMSRNFSAQVGAQARESSPKTPSTAMRIPDLSNTT